MYPTIIQIKSRKEFINKSIEALKEERKNHTDLKNRNAIDDKLKTLYFERDGVLHNIEKLRVMGFNNV